jgi:hypothetical protein
VLEESGDCRAVALAKADLFLLCMANAASYDSASRDKILLHLHPSNRDRSEPFLYRLD